MERFFNTAGPQIPEDNYCIDPLRRFDLDDILGLIRQKRYFVLHAPRQTGKTSCMLALRDYLNKEGNYIAVYANVEGGQAARNDVKSVVATVLSVCSARFVQAMPTVPRLSHRQSSSVVSAMCATTVLCSPIRILSPVALPSISKPFRCALATSPGKRFVNSISSIRRRRDRCSTRQQNEKWCTSCY